MCDPRNVEVRLRALLLPVRTTEVVVSLAVVAAAHHQEEILDLEEDPAKT